MQPTGFALLRSARQRLTRGDRLCFASLRL